MGEDLASSVEECANWCTYNSDCCVFEYILYEVGTFFVDGEYSNTQQSGLYVHQFAHSS